ncbi:MAG: sugar phosphate nucleotidyltransferase [Candidatus Promineifilaceae bacterium]
MTVHSSAEHDPWRIDFIDTGEHTEKASRIARVADYLNGDRFFVTYGDGVGNVDIGALVKFHEQHGKVGTVSAIQPGHYQYGTIEADENGLISEYAQYPPLPYWINAGFMLFERTLLDEIDAGDETPLETHVLQKLLERNELMMYRHYGFWQSMDTLKDALELDKRWRKDAPWKVWE